MAKKIMPAATLKGEQLSPEQLLAIDIFRDVDPQALTKFPGTVVRRTFSKGDVICTEGEGGTTAFYILEGNAKVFITRHAKQPKNTPKRNRLIAGLGRLFGQQPAETLASHEDSYPVSIDASKPLPYGSLTTTLGPEDIFGEMSCMNLAPRSATIVADGDCVMLEMLRHIYDVLRRAPSFREKMDKLYRERVLGNYLESRSLLRGMSPEDIERLRDEAELKTYEPGQVIFREGADPFDEETGGVYLIRLGQVRVSQDVHGQQLTLNYLSKGDYFGEIGMLRDGGRNATCTAIDHTIQITENRYQAAPVEVIRIRPDTFGHIISAYPLIRGRLEQLAGTRITHTAQLAEAPLMPALQHESEALGLAQGHNLMLIDLTRCTRCDQCVDACVAAHDDGVTRLIREGPHYDKYLVPSSCRLCTDPVCLIGCPVGSIRRSDQLQIEIEDWCIGCGVCAAQCPYDSIQMHKLSDISQDLVEEAKVLARKEDTIPVTNRAVVCDQCESLPTGPACVYACPHDAAIRVDASEKAAVGEKGSLANRWRYE